MRGRTWEPSVAWSIWDFIEGPPVLMQGGKLEWPNWREGYIAPRSPKRTAKCAACGEKITPDDDALYALDCASGSGGGWTPTGRYVHAEPCIERGDT